MEHVEGILHKIENMVSLRLLFASTTQAICRVRAAVEPQAFAFALWENLPYLYCMISTEFYLYL